MDWQEIKMGRNDRASLIGATGTGKTTLARYLIEDTDKRHSVVYDNKPSEAIGQWGPPHKLIENYEELEIAEEERLIYRPPLPETLDAERQDRFFQWIYERQYCRLYIDEAGSLRGGTTPSYHLQACLCRGREKGISTITGTQRPARIPLVLLSEAEHFYIFRLNLLADRQRIGELTGISVDRQTDLRQYEFFYFNALAGVASDKLRLDLIRR